MFLGRNSNATVPSLWVGDRCRVVAGLRARNVPREMLRLTLHGGRVAWYVSRMTTTQAPAFTYSLPTFPAVKAERETQAETAIRWMTEFAHEMPLDYWEALKADRRNGVVKPLADNQVMAQADHSYPQATEPRAPQHKMTADEVAAWLVGLGRKVEVADVDRLLQVRATDWVRGYQGTFAFLLGMAHEATTRCLSPGQAKGVLNCWRAEAMRNASTPTAPVATSAPVVPATATPVPASTTTPVEVTEGMWTTPDGGIWKVLPTREGGHFYAKRLGDDGGFEYVRGGIGTVRRTGTRMSLDEAKAYGRTTGRCCVCARLLTDPVSIEAGIGPVCSERWG